jgi:hypothetical protein
VALAAGHGASLLLSTYLDHQEQSIDGVLLLRPHEGAMLAW